MPNGDAVFMKIKPLWVIISIYLSTCSEIEVCQDWTLHDWSDEHCLKLLKNCWEALPSNGKVIFVESLLPVAPENIASSHVVFEQDLCMLARNPGGMEFEALAKKSGFSGCEVICCAYNSWVMEFQKDSTAIN